MAADWVQDIKRCRTRSKKAVIVERALIAARLGSSSAECFLYNCYLAYRPDFVYGVTDVKFSYERSYRSNPWLDFWGVLENLRLQVYQHIKINRVLSEICHEFDSEQWNLVCRPVLLKSFEPDFDINLLNTVLSNTEWQIPA